MASYIDIHTHKLIHGYPSIIDASDDFNKIGDDRFYSVGIHPCKINETTLDIQLKQLEKMMCQPNLLAIGECGLDRLCGTDFEKQKLIFIRQIKLANEIKKPLIIHCVRAHEDLLLLLRQQKSEVPVLIHGFNNKLSIAKKYLDSGFYLSFGSSIFKATQAETIKNIPVQQLFFETDDSDMDIESIYQRGAKLLDMELSALMLQIEKNATNLLSNRNIPWKI